MKPWGGRFKGKTDKLMERFSSSIAFDRVLYEQDIEGSKAHAGMLHKIGILKKTETDALLSALDEIKEEISKGTFPFLDTLEDIHMHIENRLTEKTGDLGKKLHTGRSRNDQVSLDTRMYLKDELQSVDELLLMLMKALIQKAEKEKNTVMPGYTHMQKAQAVPFAHYLMAYYYMFKRDRERIKDAMKRIDVMPLGSGAIAGSTIPLDREFVRKKLAFASVSDNSMDAVSDRDFILETIFCLAVSMMHLSRLSEDLIIFSTEAFSYISLPDALCTGSSLMPHKKNPDSLELIRGKTSRVVGDLVSLFVLLKGLPMTYNRDLQEDKEPLFDALKTTKDSIAVMTLCIHGMTANKDRMRLAVEESFMPAVEMAEYLTVKGMPFREAHEIVGKIVRDCEDKKRSISSLKTNELKKYSELFDKDVLNYITTQNIFKKRKTTGAASFYEVRKQIKKEKLYISL